MGEPPGGIANAQLAHSGGSDRTAAGSRRAEVFDFSTPEKRKALRKTLDLCLYGVPGRIRTSNHLVLSHEQYFQLIVIFGSMADTPVAIRRTMHNRAGLIPAKPRRIG